MPASSAAGVRDVLFEPAPERAAAHHLADRRAVERRRHALARHVAEHHDQRVRFGRQEIADVAAELARRIEMPGHIHAAQPLRQLLRQQRHLHALRQPQFLFEARLAVANRFVEPRVLDRHRRFRGQQRQQLDVLLVERVRLRALEVEHADAAILQQQRHHQLRSHAGNGVRCSADPW